MESCKNITIRLPWVAGFLCRAIFRGCAEIEIFGDIFTSGEAVNKEEKVRLTEKEKWEATKAEWLRIANEAKKGEGSGLTQRKPTILKSLVSEDKFVERKENRQKIGESSSVKLKDWDKVKEAMDKLAKLKRKEEELKNKMLKSFCTKLELKGELVSVREEMISIMNQVW